MRGQLLPYQHRYCWNCVLLPWYSINCHGQIRGLALQKYRSSFADLLSIFHLRSLVLLPPQHTTIAEFETFFDFWCCLMMIVSDLTASRHQSNLSCVVGCTVLSQLRCSSLPWYRSLRACLRVPCHSSQVPSYPPRTTCH